MKNTLKRLFLVLALAHITSLLFSQTTPRLPLMGWASWNNFYFNISETVIKGQADAMVSSGLSTVGYKYINIDDGFFKNRNADGSLGIDATKFPNGMKVVADYIHTKGLKAGMYAEAGSNTCGNLFGSQPNGKDAGLYGHDQLDMDLYFKTWGYDFVKVDYCGGRAQGLDEKTRYTAIKNAIINTGRTDAVYNVCRWQFPGTWVTTLADSWRIADDINNTWTAVIRIIDDNTYLAPYCSRGHYNDMDMLEVGRGMTADEDRSHFSMWCIMSSPLMLGNDLTNLSAQTKTILTNTEVIAVDQDTTGLQAHMITDNGAGLQVWAKNLNGKQSLERAVLLFNRSTAIASMTVNFADLNLVGSASVRDLWSHTDLGLKTSYTVSVPSHGVVMLKVVGTKAKLQEVFEAEYAWMNNFNLTQNVSIVANQGRATVDATCSGGAKATYIGNRADNYIEFRDIFASAAANYTLTITYACADNRSATISVNGKDTVVSNFNSGSGTTFKNLSFSVSLNKGSNTIRMSNASGWVPDIDKITVDVTKNVADVSVSLATNKTTYVQAETIIIDATASITGGTISKIEFYNGTTKLGEDATSPYSYSITNATVGIYALTAVVTDNTGNKTTSAAVNVKVTVPQASYSGTPWPVPGTIQFENYDVGGNGIAYIDSSAGNTGGATFRVDEDVDIENCTDAGNGYNIGFATAGEWLEYTVNVAVSGEYELTLRAACSGDGRTVSLSSDGNVIANSIAIPNTAGWQTWTDVKVKVTLPAGKQVLRLTIGAIDYVNLNYMTFSKKITSITLKTGWNLIGCPLDGSTDIATALSSIWANVLTVKDMNTFYNKSQAAAFNSLTKIYWGEGYWIKVMSDCALDWTSK